MDRDVCGECFSPLELCTCKKIDIFTHKIWCNHCRDHADVETHQDKCEFARLQEENKRLRATLKDIAPWLYKGIENENTD